MCHFAPRVVINVVILGVLHAFDMCNTRVCPTLVLHMYFYACNTCVRYGHVVYV